MNLKLTTVLGDITGVTGLKILRAIVAGERDPRVLAQLRDRRCKKAEPEIATALDGRYRPEHITELRQCLKMWDAYQELIAELDVVIPEQLWTMRRHSPLPPLQPKTLVR
jgi:transposase